MTKRNIRLLFVVLSATLCAAAAILLCAGNVEKLAVHWIGKGQVDLSPLLGGGAPLLMESSTQIKFEYPDKGTFEYQDFAGPWYGSYAHGDVVALHFDTYKGQLPFIPQGSPMVYMLGKIREGADFFDRTYDERLSGLPFPAYQNFDGWYKFLAFVDGGPGPKDDWVLGCVAPVPPTQLVQAKQQFAELINAGDLVCPGKVTIGDLRIPVNK
jgi:hypothetical protein